MATKTNTSKSVNKLSEAMAEALEYTQKNMTKLLTKAGVKNAANVEKVKTYIPMIPGSKDDVEFVGMNGMPFYFKRGESIDLPKPLFDILHDCGRI